MKQKKKKTTDNQILRGKSNTRKNEKKEHNRKGIEREQKGKRIEEKGKEIETEEKN